MRKPSSSSPGDSSAFQAKSESGRQTAKLHLLSWIVLVVLTICITLIIFPGMPGGDWENHHGWPFEFLKTKFADDASFNVSGSYPIHWSTVSAWSWSDRTSELKPLHFLADLIVGIAIVALAVAVCEAWRRRRGRFRFSLLDVAVAAVVFASIFGWWQLHVRFVALEECWKQAILRQVVICQSFSIVTIKVPSGWNDW